MTISHVGPDPLIVVEAACLPRCKPSRLQNDPYAKAIRELTSCPNVAPAGGGPSREGGVKGRGRGLGAWRSGAPGDEVCVASRCCQLGCCTRRTAGCHWNGLWFAAICLGRCSAVGMCFCCTACAWRHTRVCRHALMMYMTICTRLSQTSAPVRARARQHACMPRRGACLCFQKPRWARSGQQACATPRKGASSPRSVRHLPAPRNP